MPFTLAHPAAVIPLYKKAGKYFSLTGLIAGSIIPDFEYFINFHSRSEISHSWRGVFVFDLPGALLLAVLFHLCIKQTLIPNLPKKYFDHLNHYIYFNWFMWLKKNFSVFFVSAFIGIVTHIAWDAISHTTGQMVKHSNFLNDYIGFSNLTYYRMIWHLSTWGGSLYVAFFILTFKEEYIIQPLQRFQPSKHYWPAVFLFSVIIIFYRWTPFVHPFQLRDLFIALLGAALFSIITAAFIFRK